MRKVSIKENITQLLKDFLKKKAVAADATSQLGKANTALRNAIKVDLAAENATPGTFYLFDGKRVAYEVSIADAIAPEDLLEEYEEKRISREQFLRCISVSIGETSNVLGGDVVLALKQPLAGKTPDIRVKDMPVDEAKIYGNKNAMVIPDLPKVSRRKLGAKGTLSTKPKKDEAVSTKVRKLKLTR